VIRLFGGLAILFAMLSPVALSAQGANIAFGNLRQNSALPIEISADQLQVDQTEGNAVFTGHVVVGQGEMRLSADKVEVVYSSGPNSKPGQISTMTALGNVVLVNAGDAAEAQKAVYSIDRSNIVMTGNVLVTQGKSALSGQRMVVDLDTGIGQMEGQVKTIFQTGGSK